MFLRTSGQLHVPRPGTSGAQPGVRMAGRSSTPRSRPFTAAIHELAARADPAALLDLEGVILFENDAWERFARVGGGFGEVGVGGRLLDALPGEGEREAVCRLIARVGRGPGPRAASITVERNTPDLARLVTLLVSPVLSGNEAIGLTIVQRIVRELPVREVYQVVEATLEDYRPEDGVLRQCGCCRRTRHPADPAEWDFVPALVAAPPADTAFETCPLCRELHCAVTAPDDR